MIWWQELKRRFVFAFNGLALLAKDKNIRLHLFLGLLTILAGCLLKLYNYEWVLVWILIGGVLALESFNCALEKLADRVSTKPDPLIKAAKDMAAGAVLIFCIIAMGIFVFMAILHMF